MQSHFQIMYDVFTLYTLKNVNKYYISFTFFAAIKCLKTVMIVTETFSLSPKFGWFDNLFSNLLRVIGPGRHGCRSCQCHGGCCHRTSPYYPSASEAERLSGKYLAKILARSGRGWRRSKYCEEMKQAGIWAQAGRSLKYIEEVEEDEHNSQEGSSEEAATTHRGH